MMMTKQLRSSAAAVTKGVGQIASRELVAHQCTAVVGGDLFYWSGGGLGWMGPSVLYGKSPPAPDWKKSHWCWAWNVEVHEKCSFRIICLEIYLFSSRLNHHHIFIFNDPIIVIVIMTPSVGRIGHLRANSSISDSVCPESRAVSIANGLYTTVMFWPTLHCTQSIVKQLWHVVFQSAPDGFVYVHQDRIQKRTKSVPKCTKVYRSVPAKTAPKCIKVNEELERELHISTNGRRISTNHRGALITNHRAALQLIPDNQGYFNLGRILERKAEATVATARQVWEQSKLKGGMSFRTELAVLKI